MVLFRTIKRLSMLQHSYRTPTPPARDAYVFKSVVCQFQLLPSPLHNIDGCGISSPARLSSQLRACRSTGLSSIRFRVEYIRKTETTRHIDSVRTTMGIGCQYVYADSPQQPSSWYHSFARQTIGKHKAEFLCYMRKRVCIISRGIFLSYT